MNVWPLFYYVFTNIEIYFIIMKYLLYCFLSAAANVRNLGSPFDRSTTGPSTGSGTGLSAPPWMAPPPECTGSGGGALRGARPKGSPRALPYCLDTRPLIIHHGHGTFYKAGADDMPYRWLEGLFICFTPYFNQDFCHGNPFLRPLSGRSVCGRFVKCDGSTVSALRRAQGPDERRKKSKGNACWSRKTLYLCISIVRLSTLGGYSPKSKRCFSPH